MGEPQAHGAVAVALLQLPGQVGGGPMTHLPQQGVGEQGEAGSCRAAMVLGEARLPCRACGGVAARTVMVRGPARGQGKQQGWGDRKGREDRTGTGGSAGQGMQQGEGCQRAKCMGRGVFP